MLTEGRSPNDPLRLHSLAVASGKGGVGKTFMAVNLALLAARRGQRVLVVDGDLGLANVEIAVGARPRHHLGDVLAGNADIHDALVTGPAGVRILPAGSGLPSLARLGRDEQAKLLGLLAPLAARFDVVFVDCGAGIGENVVFFAATAEACLLVVSPEPTALADAYATVKVLSASGSVSEFLVVVNGASSDAQARATFGRLQGVVSQFLPVRLRWLGAVPHDEAVPRAVMARRAVVEHDPRAPASRALEALSKELQALPRPTQAAGHVELIARGA
jgi:flagellar biosynthesis protein FlhG